MAAKSPKERTFLASADRQADIWRWLEANTPREWHLFAQHYDWQGGPAPLFWIVTQVKCDAGTAADIFLLADPYDTEEIEAMGDAAKPGSFDHDIWEMLLAISSRWQASGYPAWNYASSMLTEDARAILNDAIEAQRARSKARLLIPASMAAPSAAAEAVSADDYPPKFADYFWNLISETWRDGTLGPPVTARRN